MIDVLLVYSSRLISDWKPYKQLQRRQEQSDSTDLCLGGFGPDLESGSRQLPKCYSIFLVHRFIFCKRISWQSAVFMRTCYQTNEHQENVGPLAGLNLHLWDYKHYYDTFKSILIQRQTILYDNRRDTNNNCTTQTWPTSDYSFSFVRFQWRRLALYLHEIAHRHKLSGLCSGYRKVRCQQVCCSKFSVWV